MTCRTRDEGLVIAPHPDDETLGCGGAMLRHRQSGDEISLLFVTEMTEAMGYSAERVRARSLEIDAVRSHYGIANFHELKLPTAQLDAMPLVDIIGKIADVVSRVRPEIVYLPNPGDVHSDHTVVFDACAASLKWTKAPTVRRIVAYEALSETDLALSDRKGLFHPNHFVNITDYLDDKIAAMKIYSSEMGEFPFPRSETAIRAQAQLRGAACGFAAAEAFMILRDNW